MVVFRGILTYFLKSAKYAVIVQELEKYTFRQHTHTRQNR